MAQWLKLLERAAITGTAASVTSSLALLAVAAAEGRGALQPVNATSHWLHGPDAADIRIADISHTGVGYATHHAATFFWAMIFERWIERHRPLAGLPLMRDAMVMATVAAAVDYTATPKRFTPGWEFVLSRKSMALVYAALAAGLVLGTRAVDRGEAREGRAVAREPGNGARGAILRLVGTGV